MIRPILTAAALILPALPAVAQTAAHVPAGHGAIAGRSPHQAYRAVAATPSCAVKMHTIPAGKLPTYGTHALPTPGCAPAEVAAADRQTRQAQD